MSCSKISRAVAAFVLLAGCGNGKTRRPPSNTGEKVKIVLEALNKCREIECHKKVQALFTKDEKEKEKKENR